MLLIISTKKKQNYSACSANLAPNIIPPAARLHQIPCSTLSDRNIRGRASPVVTSEMFIRSISAAKVTEMIRSSGESRSQESFHRRQGKWFVNWTQSIGTVRNVCTADALVVNPYSKRASFAAVVLDCGFTSFAVNRAVSIPQFRDF
jgi:hypothetical protein